MLRIINSSMRLSLRMMSSVLWVDPVHRDPAETK